MVDSWPAMPLDPWHYAGMGFMVLLGACLQGMGGLGFAMFCAPLAALLYPVLVPGPLLALGLPLALMAGLREFSQIDWGMAGSALAGRFAGTVMATLVMTMLPVTWLAYLFATLILLAVALSVAGWRLTPTRPTLGAAGVASGLMATITSAGAAPFAIAMQDMPAARLRATLGCIFTLGTLFSLIGLGSVGLLGREHLMLSVILLPWLLVGFVLSNPLNRLLLGRSLRPLLLGLAVFAAVGVLIRAAVQG